MKAEHLLQLAMQLLAYTKDKERFEDKVFLGMLNSFGSLYKKTGVAEQGEYHELWSKNLENIA